MSTKPTTDQRMEAEAKSYCKRQHSISIISVELDFEAGWLRSREVLMESAPEFDVDARNKAYEESDTPFLDGARYQFEKDKLALAASAQRIAVLEEALKKLIKNVESDCMTCDTTGVKLGAGWAFVTDVETARKALRKSP